MMPMTPSGTRTRSIVMPFGRVQCSVTLPTGSCERAHHLEAVRHGGDPRVIQRQPVEKAGVAPTSACARSRGIGRQNRRLEARTASAIAARARSFCARGASASTRAAERARCPMSCITLAQSVVLSMVLSGAVMLEIRLRNLS